jgi:putative membrane protein
MAGRLRIGLAEGWRTIGGSVPLESAMSSDSISTAAISTAAIATPPSSLERKLLLAIVVLALVVSGIAPKDRLTWFLEVVWVIVAIPLIAWKWPVFPLTRLLCWLLVAHALVLIHGGAYTYAETPIGFWMRDTAIAMGLEVTRNPWDRIGHLMQGFVPAILARELFLRCTPPAPDRTAMAAGCSIWCWRRA